VTLRELNDLTKSILAEGLIRLGLIEDASGLTEYYFHGVAHHLGLDTHDVAQYTEPLQPGMVVTIEPGLYIAEEAIGIRIEDDVLVTEDGYEVLSPQIPKSIADMEALVGTNVK
jgi:Xaa-Pro aminopeptidase